MLSASAPEKARRGREGNERALRRRGRVESREVELVEDDDVSRTKLRAHCRVERLLGEHVVDDARIDDHDDAVRSIAGHVAVAGHAARISRAVRLDDDVLGAVIVAREHGEGRGRIRALDRAAAGWPHRARTVAAHTGRPIVEERSEVTRDGDDPAPARRFHHVAKQSGFAGAGRTRDDCQWNRHTPIGGIGNSSHQLCTAERRRRRVHCCPLPGGAHHWP